MGITQELTAKESWANPCELINHIVAVHHDYLRMTVPELEQLSGQITEEGQVPPRLMNRLDWDFTLLLDLLETHISEQEGWLFPMIRHFHEAVGETEWGGELGGSLEWLMDRLSRENQETLAVAERVQRCLHGAGWISKGPLVKRLIEEVRSLRDDLTNHMNLETNILFPQVREQVRAGRFVSSGLLW